MRQSTISLSVLATLVSVTIAAPSLSLDAAICNIKGYLPGSVGYSTSTKDTQAACVAACVADTANCKSSCYGNGICILYNVPVAIGFQVDLSSPFTFCDVTCPTSSVSASTTTSPSTSKATTTSKAATTTTTSSSKATTTKATTTSSSTTTSPKATTTSSSTTSKSSTKSTTTSSSAIKSTTTTITSSKLATTASTTTSSKPSQTTYCPLPTWTINAFSYIDSANNLDCATLFVSSPLCLPNASVQPLGYGPPDVLDISVSSGCPLCPSSVYHAANPAGGNLLSVAIGSGAQISALTSNSKQTLSFLGSGRSANSDVTIEIREPFTCGGVTGTAVGSVTVKLSCVYNAALDATCTIPIGVVVAATKVI